MASTGNSDRRMICMVSTEGKSNEQIAHEAWEAYQQWMNRNPQEPFPTVVK